ncbi:MAG: hypothetical protein Q4D19_08335 [Lautropia sp.]|nr:hypothetical protein [Lautropia sp.]
MKNTPSPSRAVAADEQPSLKETAHLLRAPANAKRLLDALQRSYQGTSGADRSVEQLRRDIGHDDPA